MAKRPGWFIIVIALLILWGLAGSASFYMHLTLGAAQAGTPDPWDEVYYAALPKWFDVVYAIAVAGGLLGSVALLAGSRLARFLYLLSLVAVIVQFGYVFLGTDLIAHKGVLVATGFPIFILVMALVQLRVAGYAAKRGWTR